MHVPVRLLICYLQTQAEAENERKIEVNQLMTTRDDFLWSLSHSVTNLEGKNLLTKVKPDFYREKFSFREEIQKYIVQTYLTLGGNHRFTGFTEYSELEAKGIQVLGS